MHVNNSNIREIPLVDNLPAVKKTVTVNKTVPIVEEEVSFVIFVFYLFQYSTLKQISFIKFICSLFFANNKCSCKNNLIWLHLKILKINLNMINIKKYLYFKILIVKFFFHELLWLIF